MSDDKKSLVPDEDDTASVPDDSPGRSMAPRPGRATQRRPTQPQTDRLIISNYLLFGTALTILSFLLFLNWQNDSNQFNVSFLCALGLSCSMLFAFLPTRGSLNVGWVNVGGAAVVFVVMLWQLVPAAQEMKRRESEVLLVTAHSRDLINGLEAKILALETRQKQLEGERNAALLSQDSSQALRVQLSAVRTSLTSAQANMVLAQKSLELGRNFSSAAGDNTNDNPTCSLRGRQGALELDKTVVSFKSVSSSIADALSALALQTPPK